MMECVSGDCASVREEGGGAPNESILVSPDCNGEGVEFRRGEVPW